MTLRSSLLCTCFAMAFLGAADVAHGQDSPFVPNARISLRAFTSDEADLDGDGVPGPGDYALLSGDYGVRGAAATDLNGDGLVNAADYPVWRDDFDRLYVQGAGQGVPEPRGVLLVAVALGSLFGRAPLQR